MRALNNGVLNKGNLYRIERVMKKAMNGETITIGFLGGSITQGCLSSTPETCYAYLTYRWWCKRFPKAQFKYVNAGIGGTTSQFGVARAEDDLLSKNVDFTVVEFSVNDDNNQHFQETYEGLIRRIYFHETAPAVLIVNSVRYDDGINAQDIHLKIGKAYEIPCVSMKPTLYSKVLNGTYKSRDITEDDLHPNDKGHRLMTDIITGFLENVYEELKAGKKSKDNYNEIKAKATVTLNGYENSKRFQNYNSDNIIVAQEGFIADNEPQNDIREIFRKGWTAGKEGDHIRFIVEGTCIGAQYRKSIIQPTPIATAIIDGDTDRPVILDGNFDETWGDSIHLTTLAEHLPYGKHVVEITLTTTHDNDKVPFYLVSLIVS
jgi:lysophospholipase L1-like esterase